MKTIESFDFTQSTSSRTRYDWNTLMNGEIYQLEEGEDFKPGSKYLFRAAVTTQASRRGLHVRLSTVPNGVVIQAYGHDDPDRAERANAFILAEKAKFAELKAKEAAKKAASTETVTEVTQVEEVPTPTPEPPKPTPAHKGKNKGR